MQSSGLSANGSAAFAGSRGRSHILVYDPRTEGHHVSYLRFISEDLLCRGHRVTLAIDTSPAPIEKIRAELGSTLEQVNILSLQDMFGRRRGKRSSYAVSRCLFHSRADIAFLPNFDEIASRMLRRAAIGLLPHENLRGRLGGIYFRPRFLTGRRASLNQRLKAVGFSRMLRDGWFHHLFFLDPYLCERFKSSHPEAPVSYIPDPYPDDFNANRQEARRAFELGDRRVFLFYGASYPRKGLPLAIGAMQLLPQNSPALLLCAGEHLDDYVVVQHLAALEASGKARVIARYVSADEEKRLFAASDVVLLPYHRHEGSSGVLVRAVGAGVPVIASDEGLMGQFVRDLGLGLVFPSGDVSKLRDAMVAMTTASNDQMEKWHAAARDSAPRWSRTAFRQALLAPLGEVDAGTEMGQVAQGGTSERA